MVFPPNEFPLAGRVSLAPHRAYPLILLSAPAGTGKTTVTKLLLRDRVDIQRAISCTTRAPRAHERHGIDYYFATPSKFKELHSNGQFLEWVELFGAKYGTLQGEVERLQSGGYRAILVIDVQGALELQRRFRCQSIFLMPPSQEELKRRLLSRGTEKSAQLHERLKRANFEIAQSALFDHCVVNDDLQIALKELKELLRFGDGEGAPNLQNQA